MAVPVLMKRSILSEKSRLFASKRLFLGKRSNPCFLTVHDQLAGVLNDGQIKHRPRHGPVAHPGNDSSV